MNVLNALASISSLFSLHVRNPLIEDYTQIFCMIDEEEIP
jgi:hypothetical protein